MSVDAKSTFQRSKHMRLAFFYTTIKRANLSCWDTLNLSPSISDQTAQIVPMFDNSTLSVLDRFALPPNHIILLMPSYLFVFVNITEIATAKNKRFVNRAWENRPNRTSSPIGIQNVIESNIYLT